MAPRPRPAADHDGVATVDTQISLSAAARRRGLIVLLAATFLTWGGFFVVVPLIAVHYVDGLGWAASSVGLVLAVRQFTQQGTTTLSGALADRLGAKGLICAGMLVRALGFAIMARADSFAILMLSAIVTALGGGLFEAPKAAAIATLTDESNRRRFYSLAGVVAGLGVAIGTQVGALLIKADFAVVSLVGAVVFLVTFLLVLVFLPPVRVATESHGLIQGFASVSRDRIFVAYVALLMGYWFMWAQFNLSLTLAAASVAGTDSAVAWVYGVSSAVAVILGYPLPRLVERRLAAFTTLVLGIVLTALGMGAVGAASSVPALLVCVFVISLGSVLVLPGEQTVTAGMAAPTARGSYFGVAALSLAIGGGIGHYAGGLVYDYGERAGLPALPWLLYCGVGTAAAVGLWRLRRAVVAGERRLAGTGAEVGATPSS
ncbi:MAG: transporter, family, multidrug resistance protein [Thermomicrobiales bacterium]|nr:transporter, family, multidrug resistance protein [Thermomicrobiales bacterium]